MRILKTSELQDEKVTALIYAPPGYGKTTLLGALPGRTLIIDVEGGTSVLKGSGSEADIVRLGDTPGGLKEIYDELEKNCPYDNVCIDSLSELEKWMLTILGRNGKNNGAPELGHYNQVSFKLIDYVRLFRSLPCNLILTAWETLGEVIASSGEKFTRSAPMLTGKTPDNVCGLCDVVGEIIISSKDETRGQRFVRLSSDMSTVAKDRLRKRAFCAFEELI
jgi:phage nucleotide-binding protein